MANAAYYGNKPDLPADPVANVAALTSSAASGGDAPTEAEHNAVRTDVSNVRTTLNNLLATLRSAGVLDS